MIDLSLAENQIQLVSTAQELLVTTFEGVVYAMCWARELSGDFSEIIQKIELTQHIQTIELEELQDLHLSEQGQLARAVILQDLELLQAHGASPILNVIEHYTRDTDSFFPTDVYSFHVDHSPVPTDTFLCTYYGEPSELLPNSQATQKVLIPEIRNELKTLYHGTDENFDSFLSEYFYDLHYEAKPNAHPISLGVGHLWKLAVDYPGSSSLPCIHRAPNEKPGQKRLLLIC